MESGYKGTSHDAEQAEGVAQSEDRSYPSSARQVAWARL